jgi:DNA-binding helix-hairpin-helix protein with protein kinase domain
MSLNMQQGRLLAGDAMEYRLGDVIAEGGEGIVYRVRERDDVVAKLYKEWQPGRDRKLTCMIALKSNRLTKIAAWPLSQLRDENEEMVGFVMERLETGWQPLHAIYQIRSRLEFAPNRTYQFLVRTGRNIAACVHQVHAAGLVIGDLNESNVLVNREAMAKVIDVDSFQLVDDNKLYPCKVGKAELMAPELHGLSMENFLRSTNHDGFALAALMFQVLVFGRHPFAGRPTSEEEIHLEDAIQKGWYPYTQRRTVPLQPPPHLSLDFLPPNVRELFEDAFDPAVKVRPSAQMWFDALKELEDQLTACPYNGGHAYWKGNRECPWCDLESRWNVPLFMPTLPVLQSGEPIDVDAIWDRVSRLPAPKEADAPEVMDYTTLTPATLPTWKKILVSPLAADIPWWVFIPIATASREYWKSAPWILFLLIALVAVVMFGSAIVVGPLRHRLKGARKHLEKLRAEWDRTADPAVYQAAVNEIDELRRKLTTAESRLKEARDGKIRDIYRPQLERYLEKYSILAADAGPIGSGKLSYLHDRGFRTAADITEERVKKGKDGDDAFWRDLLTWRNTLEKQFWSTSNFPLNPAQERDVIIRVQKEDAQMRERLKAAESDLLDLRTRLAEQQRILAEAASPHLRTIEELGPRLLAIEGKRD